MAALAAEGKESGAKAQDQKITPSSARIMKGRPFEGMVRLVVQATKLTAQRSTL